MIKIVIEKAEPTHGCKPPEDVLISIHRTDGLDDRPVTEVEAVFRDDATAICEALYHSLPGGTFSRLLGLMLKKRASQFIVSFGHVENKK